MLYVKKVDVIRSLFDYLEKEKTIGECLDAVPVIDLAAMRAEIAGLNDADHDFEGYFKAVTDALSIIDKYLGVIE